VVVPASSILYLRKFDLHKEGVLIYLVRSFLSCQKEETGINIVSF